MHTIRITGQRSDAFMENMCEKGLLIFRPTPDDSDYWTPDGQSVAQREEYNFATENPWVQMTYEYLRVDGDFTFVHSTSGVWFCDDPVGYTDLIIEIDPKEQM